MIGAAKNMPCAQYDYAIFGMRYAADDTMLQRARDR